MHQPRGRAVHVLYGDLVKAIQRESNAAVAYWWGVTTQTVTKWRKALGVEPYTAGTLAAYHDHFMRNYKRMRAAVLPSLKSPERAAKIAAAKRGVPRPKHVMAALRKANLGRKLSAEQRAKMSAAHKRRGTRPPAAGVAWSKKEDQLVRTLQAAEVANRTGRTLPAVYSRRRLLGINDGRATRWR